MRIELASDLHLEFLEGMSPQALLVEPARSMSPNVSYQLRFELTQPLRCVIGRLGEFEFPAGRYQYTGSARRGFEARIARHLRSQKALRWHIDYLIGAPGVRITRVIRSARDECELNQASSGVVVARGFGASDCRSGCGAHLKYLG
ncbi:MAG: GIY-YIG nuclease family protein [Rubrivivax sp.]